MSYVQEPPFAVQVEAVEGCNLSCSFCAMNSIRPAGGGPYFYMETETAERIASEMARLDWHARVEFAMHGEPTMHPRLEEIIAAFRKHLPKNQLMVTSNGGGLLGRLDRIPALFSAGLNVLALDDYDGVTIVPRVRSAITEQLLSEWNAVLYDYPADQRGHPHRRHARDARIITVVEDLLSAHKGTHSLVINQAGQAGPPTESQAGKRCAKPFRELSFRYNGKVSVCCNDFRGVYKVGDVTEISLDELWGHPRFTAARNKLYHGERDFGPCKGCDARSYRTGLLPDHWARVTLPKADDEDYRHIAEALAGPPLGMIQVKRPWDSLEWLEGDDVTVYEQAKVDQ